MINTMHCIRNTMDYTESINGIQLHEKLISNGELFYLVRLLRREIFLYLYPADVFIDLSQLFPALQQDSVIG